MSVRTGGTQWCVVVSAEHEGAHNSANKGVRCTHRGVGTLLLLLLRLPTTAAKFEKQAAHPPLPWSSGDMNAINLEKKGRRGRYQMSSGASVELDLRPAAPTHNNPVAMLNRTPETAWLARCFGENIFARRRVDSRRLL